MFLSLDQPRIFLSCLVIGVVSGLVYEPFSFLKLLFKNKTFGHFLDVLWLAVCSFILIFLGVKFSLSEFRPYMYFSMLIGAYLYNLSFHKIFAFLENKLYNITNKVFLKLSGKVKEFNERRKEKKSVLGSAVRNDNASNFVSGNRNLSNSGNSLKKKQNRRVGRGNSVSKIPN